MFRLDLMSGSQTSAPFPSAVSKAQTLQMCVRRPYRLQVFAAKQKAQVGVQHAQTCLCTSGTVRQACCCCVKRALDLFEFRCRGRRKPPELRINHDQRIRETIATKAMQQLVQMRSLLPLSESLLTSSRRTGTCVWEYSSVQYGTVGPDGTKHIRAESMELQGRTSQAQKQTRTLKKGCKS